MTPFLMYVSALCFAMSMATRLMRNRQERYKTIWERTYRLHLTQNKVFEILKTTSSERSFNPVQDFITQETWDGQPRIATTLIDYLGAEDTPLVRGTDKTMVRGGCCPGFHPRLQV